MVIDLENQEQTEVPLHRILLVEEDPVSIEETKKILTAKGYTVSLAKDGGQAQGTLRMTPPDLILMQAILPGESGFEICEKIKQHHPRIPIIVYTEITLESAYNLAERVGADGYLVRPADPEKLFFMMKSCAEAVWERRIEEESGEKEDGVIKFSCRCGQKFKEKFENKGKFTTCPSCQQRIQIPNRSIQQFITDQADRDQDSSSAELQPLKFVTVKCSACSTFYKLSSVEGDWRKCPRCEHVQSGSLSIVGAPMSRAALESSLRVLRVLNGKSKGKKLMLPEREIVFGRGEGCDIRNKQKTVSEKHCSMEPTPEGILIRDLGSEHGTYIDGERVQEGILKAGRVLQIGAIKLRLIGEDLSVEEELQRVQKWSQKEQEARKRGIRMIEAGKETAAEAAQVIQQHWNITRKRMSGEAVGAAAE